MKPSMSASKVTDIALVCPHKQAPEAWTMNTEFDFWIAFVILFTIGAVIQTYFGRRNGANEQPAIGDGESVRQGRRRIVWGMAFMALLVVYVFVPDWLA